MDLLKLAAAGLAVAAAHPAAAHVSVHPKTAPAGAYQALRFGVGHGCDGQATTRVTIQIPTGVETARPQPKPGWRLSIARDPANRERVAALTWTGRLPADQYEEFLVLVRLPRSAQGEALSFPSIQACGKTQVRWDGRDAAHPAPRLQLAPAGAPEPRHDHH